MKRFSYWFLFAIFVVAIVTCAIRPLRVSPLYQVIGVIQFAAMAVTAWILGARAITTTSREARMLALAGIFLVTPFALLALLWVGLGPPWVATPAENQMRYLILSAMSVAIVIGFVVLRDALGEADEKFRPSVGFATILLAGPLYLIFDAFGFGISTVKFLGVSITCRQLGKSIAVHLGRITHSRPDIRCHPDRQNTRVRLRVSA